MIKLYLPLIKCLIIINPQIINLKIINKIKKIILLLKIKLSNNNKINKLKNKDKILTKKKISILKKKQINLIKD